MRAAIERWGRGLVALAALAALAACTIGREPAYDAALAGEITELTAGMLRLFQEFAPGASGAHADRERRSSASTRPRSRCGSWRWRTFFATRRSTSAAS